ncbi:AAA family ATPase, partial [Nitratireductor sp. GCM10026969]|uniref:AAA family ATPase n=1 Tax=Nitratireductor sp. GCM10026969 TaxID=3252645 RepID=UPI003611C9F8
MTTAESASAGSSGHPAQVHITKLQLANFRNYASLSLGLEPGAVVLTGENGAGKTNLLEAVSFLSPGRGLRRATLDDVTRIGSTDGFAVHTEIAGPFGTCRIGTGTAGEGAESARRVRINGET